MIRILPNSAVNSKASAVVEIFAELPNYWTSSESFEGFTVEQFRFDSQDVWQKAVSDCGRWHLWIEGRPFLEGKPRKGEHVTAALLQAILASGSLVETVLSCDGGVTAFLYDSKKGILEVATDLIGLYPAFTFQNGVAGISTHSEWLAEVSLEELTIDETSFLEQVYHSSVSPPYTFYNEMRELAGGSFHTFDAQELKELSNDIFWTPEIKSELSYEDSVSLLAEGLKESVVLRTQQNGSKTIFLSGGADSRLILGANQDPSNTSAMTLVDIPNAESEISKKLAKIGKVSHEVVIRDRAHYSRTAENALEISGGFGSPMDNHFLSVLNDPRIQGADTILTGCHGDYFFKSVFAPKTSLRIFGRNLPIRKLKEDLFSMPKHIPNLSPDIIAKLEERWEKRLQWARNLSGDDPNAIEASRVLPMSREIDSLFRSPMARILPWDPLFYSRKLLSVMWRVPLKYKIDGRYYEEAVSMVVGPELSKVKNANFGSPLAVNPYLKTIYYLITLVKKFASKKNQLSSSSWPNYKALLSSDEKLKKLINSDKELFKSAPFLNQLMNKVREDRHLISIDIVYNAIGIVMWFEKIKSRKS